MNEKGIFSEVEYQPLNMNSSPTFSFEDFERFKDMITEAFRIPYYYLTGNPKDHYIPEAVHMTELDQLIHDIEKREEEWKKSQNGRTLLPY